MRCLVMHCFPVSGSNSFIAFQTNLLQGEIVTSSQFDRTFLSITRFLFETFCLLNFYFLAIGPPTLTNIHSMPQIQQNVHPASEQQIVLKWLTQARFLFISIQFILTIQLIKGSHLLSNTGCQFH